MSPNDIARNNVNRNRSIVAIIATIAIAAGAFLLAGCGDGNDSGRPKPEIVSVEQLQNLEADEGHPVYWGGPRKNVQYELTKTASGRIFIRYLPEGVEAGDPRPNYLSVGTYPYDKAYATLKKLARKQGSVSGQVEGGLAVYERARPNSVYLAYPGMDYEIEVYDPTARRARQLVFNGVVEPVR